MKKFNFSKKHKKNNLGLNNKEQNKNKISNKLNKIEIKPQFLVIGLVVIIAVISLIYFIFLKYSPIMNFRYEGYGISGKQITENLLGASGDKENIDSQNSDLSDNDGKNASLTKIEEQDTIFKKLNSYFIGNKKKTEIDLNYPIYINDKNTIYNLSQSITLISKNFEQVAGYPNISITDGKVYNGNSLERADSKEYIFAKTEEGIYINLKEIKIETTANEYVLPVNSLIVFEENGIRYYSIQNNILVFNEIKDVDYNSQVIIKNVESNTVDTNSQKTENANKVDNEYNYEELLTRLGIIENAKDTVEKEEIIEEDTSDDKKENNTESEPEPNAPQDQKPENNEQTNAEYIKPEVTVEDFKAEVYTAKSNLTIKDPKARIIEAPTFEIYKDGKIYLRRVFKNSGEIQITGLVPETEYEIIGKYIYLNAENKKVENTFYKGTIKTKGYEALGTIELSKEKGEIYSNKIQIKNVKIISDLQNEAIKGINQIELETGNIKTVLKNNKVNELLEGKEVTIESSEGLKSNTKIEYAIKFYDKNGKELKVENNKGTTRTSKQEPKVTVKIKEQDIVSVTLGLKLTNKDSVKLENYKYIITRPNGEKLKEERLSEHEKEIKLEDLDQNQYYKIKVYADYDLGDNKGTQKDVEIGNLVFATKPISTLGSLEMIVENKELTSQNAKISYKIDEDKTDKRLIQILNELTIKIVENNDDNKEISKPSAEEQNSEKESQHTNRNTTKEGTVIYTNTLTKEEIERLQLGEIKEINYENLKSNTKYTIEITGNVQLGNTQENIQVTYNYKEFTTLKIPAKVEIRNQFVTGNLIDLDVRVEDEDKSVLNNKVRMELRDEKSNLIDLQEIETNKGWLRKTYEKLEENKTYKLSFYADQYNEGSTDETYKVNRLIKEIEIVTEPGISGSIGLTELAKKATGKNLVDISSEIKWYVYPNFNTNDYYGKEYNKETKILTLGGHGNFRRAVYDLREYAEQEVTMSFKAKAVSGSQTTYIQNSKIDKNRILIQNLTEEWNDYKYTLVVDNTGYLGFYIEGGNGIEVKELQIELGNKKTSYEEFKYTLQSSYSINLEDKRDEIATNDYYIKIYEDNNLVKEDRYEEIPEENVITNAIKTYEVQLGRQYKVELTIKMKEREYVISSLEYDTKETEEIKGIYNKENFLEIQPKGHYMVLGDIDLRGGINNQYRFGSDNMPFEGKIDFNGHRVIKDLKNTNQLIICKTSKNAVIENIVVELYINNEIEKGIVGAIVYNNYGVLNNIQIQVKQCSRKENTEIGLIAINNFGTINNFYIKLEAPLYGDKNIGTACLNNFGIVKNGYIYGQDIYITNKATSNKNVGGIVSANNDDGVVENVYATIKVNFIEEKKDGTVGNIVGLNRDRSIVRNCYTYESGEKNISGNGPGIGNSYNAAIAENIYYFAGDIKNNSYNIKTTPLALHDKNFQKQILNMHNAFDIENTVTQGYYPQLKMPDCMPPQEYIELPEVEDSDLPDILSTEVTENNNITVKVKFSVNNPPAENITNIKMENIECEIVSQKYYEGKSEVIAILKNPTIYTSEYDVLSITSKGAFDAEYTRHFKANERRIFVDLYKEIYTLSDWIQINNSPKENYKIMSDLDFRNAGREICVTNKYTGILDGNGHTLNNITLTKNGTFFSTVTGKIENLNVQNLKIKNAESYFVGFISQLNGGTVDRLNFINVEITATGKGDMQIGTISCGSQSGHIENCTVNNLKITSTASAKSRYAGGIISSMTNEQAFILKNCYVQNFDIIIKNVINETCIGGIMGNLSGGGSIQNCYAIGKIDTDAENVGGIVGKSFGKGIIEKCYSKVDIDTSGKTVGGIIGNVDWTPATVINNIAIGDIYSSVQNTLSRAIGTNIDNMDNYAYKDQRLNGYIEQEYRGANLLSYEQILNSKTYHNLGFNAYDTSKLTELVLPKLFDTDGKDLLPNQKDSYLEENNKIIINNIEIEKNSENKAQIRLELQKQTDIQISKIQIENIEVEDLNIINNGTMSYINLRAIPIKYYDNYKISEIKYIQNNEVYTIEKPIKISLSFYKEIYNLNDWQTIDKYGNENYKLMGDIDFSGIKDINTSLQINRLVSDNTMHTLRNLNIKINKEYDGLISQLKTELRNIRFENITIENTNYSNIGVIGISSGKITNIEAENITINSAGGSQIGFIGRAYGNCEHSNITLKHIKYSGNSEIGAFIGRDKNSTINTITLEDIYIKSKLDEVGGVIGRIETTGHLLNIKADDIALEGANYIGGIVGLGTSNISNNTINDVNIIGNSYLGGIKGNGAGSIEEVVVNQAKIRSMGSNIGGIVGSGSNVTKSSLNDIHIESLVSGEENIGGIIGDCSNRININQTNITDGKINTEANNVGAFVGKFNGQGGSIRFNYAVNLEIIGKKNVGGIVGLLKEGTVSNNYNNTKITAKNGCAGGIVGYLDNTNMTNLNNKSTICYNYYAGGMISGQNNIGGIIGDTSEILYTDVDCYYRNFVEAKLESNEQTTISLGVGGMSNQNQFMKHTYYYKYSSINGENPNVKNEVFIPQDKYLVEAELKQQSTYTSKLGWYTTQWDFTRLVNSKYPTIKDNNLSNQEGIDLPKDSEHIIGNKVESNSLETEILKEELEGTFEYDNKEIKTYNTYSIITATDGSKATRNVKLYVKDNNLYAIPSILSSGQNLNSKGVAPVANNIILDNYNGKEYETVLGSDGKIYDLKEPIEYPENFANSDIESIGNNLNNNSHEVEVTYKNGDKLKFNYQTGETISASEVNSETVSLFEYLKEKISKIGDSSSNKISKEIMNEYEDGKKLRNKLEKTSIEEAIKKQNNSNHIENVANDENNETNNSLKETRYISIYNEEKDDYQIYQEEELLDTSKQEVISENEKIEANNLKKYYASEGEVKNTKMGIVWIALSIIGVVIILFAIKKRD